MTTDDPDSRLRIGTYCVNHRDGTLACARHLQRWEL